MHRYCASVAIATIVALSATSPAQADQLYMGEGIFAPNSIWRMNSNDPNGTFTTLRNNTEQNSVRDIFLDDANGFMYWTADHPLNSQTPAKIRRADLNGNNVVDIPVTQPLGQVFGINVDPATGFIFYATFPDTVAGASNGLMRTPIGGGGALPIATLASGTFQGVAVDPAAQRIYATANDFTGGKRVVSMNYDGTGLVTLYNLPNTVTPGDIEIDVPRNRLVFTHSDGGDRHIAVGSLDGTAMLDIIDVANNADFIALSLNGRKVFFSDISDDDIYSVHFNGTREKRLRGVPNAFALEVLVPEPASLMLVALGGLALTRRRR